MNQLASNKRARFDYEILETFEAGLVLLGFEAKALRQGRGQLTGAHILIRGGEAYLVGASIPPYQPQNTPPGYDPERVRTLLLTKKEIATLLNQSEVAGNTIIPLNVFQKNGKLKLALALAKGKKKHDKRETIKERETKRNLNRIIKRGL